MRIKVFCKAFLFFMLSTVVLYAQSAGPGQPCGGTDPDANCPLDTWVIVLAFVAVVFASLSLYRKQNKTNIGLKVK